MPVEFVLPTGFDDLPVEPQEFWQDTRTGLYVAICGDGTHRNAYVQLPALHPWHDESKIDADVHGGVTWLSDHWIGFDTGHPGDVWEDLPNRIYPDELDQLLGGYLGIARHAWTMAELRREATSLALQVGLAHADPFYKDPPIQLG